MNNPHKGRTGLDRVIRAAGYSTAGLLSAYKNESAFRQEVWLALVLLPLAFWLGSNWTQVLMLLASAWLVLIVELLNSSIEAAVDRISFEHHELAKRAKDMASAAVLLSLLLCGTVWIAVAWQRLSAVQP